MHHREIKTRFLPRVLESIQTSLPILAIPMGTVWKLNAGLGGGLTQAGWNGEYFTNNQFIGAPAAVRREARLDFRPSHLSPGGAGRVGDAQFRAIPADGFSARWIAGLICREQSISHSNARRRFRSMAMFGLKL